MRKVILMMLLAGMSSSAMADWFKYSTNENGTNYVDLATRHRHGGTVKMWEMVDYNAAQTIEGRHIESYISQEEFDCDEGQYRPLSLLAHPESMGKGDVVFSVEAPGRWIAMIPDTVGNRLYDIACSKK